jgi:hypothetical protein
MLTSPHLARPDILRALGLLATLAALLVGAARMPSRPALPQPPAAPVAAAQVGQLPLSFMPTGNDRAPFAAHGPAGSLAFQPGAVLLQRPGANMQVHFVGASAGAQLSASNRQAGSISDHTGDRAHWRDRIPLYASLEYRQLYPGIDLRYDGDGGQLKGTYAVAPGADPGQIRWRYQGATLVALDPASGDLQITLADGSTLVERAPIAWQTSGGSRTPVTIRFALDGGEASFALGAYDQARPLVIDPALEVSTFLGGGSADYGRGVAVDKQGNIYVVGEFFSSDFLGDSTPTSGSTDVIVLKLNPSASEVLYGWYLGGTGGDEGLAIAVNEAGEAYILVDPGADFPMQNAPIGQQPETGDGVLVKFDAAGNQVFSTYLGFDVSNTITGNAIAVGPTGAVYITGQSYVAIRRLGQVSIVQANPASGAIVHQFDRGDLYADTYGAALAIDSAGTVYVAGQAFDRFGTQFPTTPDGFQATCARKLSLGADRDCDEDAFVMALNPDLTLRYASFLGGAGGDSATGVGVDKDGNVIVVGSANSPDFPIKNALIPACPADPSLNLCSYDGFAAKLSLTSGLVYSTYITSGQPEDMTFVTDVAVDAAGNAFVYGFTSGESMPIKDAIQPSIAPGLCLGGFNRFCFDVFVTELAPDGSLAFGTYLGGKFDEYSGSIALDGNGRVYVSGRTDSSDFPTSPGSVQPSKSANTDFFVSRLSLAGSGGGDGGGGQYTAFLPFISH